MTSDDVRTRVQEISERARTDRAFMQEVMNDPQGTLSAAGIPSSTIDEVVAEWDKGAREDVSGYMMCGWTCLGTTCEKLSESCGGDASFRLR